MSRHTLILWFGLVSAASCFEPPPGVDPAVHRRESLDRAAQLAEQAVPLKNHGRNAEALALFEQARALLDNAGGDNRAALASNLDDIASIKARLGDFAAARELYRRAQAELKALGAGPSTKLHDGIDERLSFLDALEQAGLVCHEAQSHVAAPGALPYFPERDTALDIIGRELNPLLQGCLNGEKKEIKTRLLLTGDGRLLAARVHGTYAGTPVGACIEERILTAAPGLVGKLPRFAACFRPLSYPFVVASPEAWREPSPDAAQRP